MGVCPPPVLTAPEAPSPKVPPPVSNECLVQRTLPFGPYFLRILFAGHGRGLWQTDGGVCSPSALESWVVGHRDMPTHTLSHTHNHVVGGGHGDPWRGA